MLLSAEILPNLRISSMLQEALLWRGACFFMLAKSTFQLWFMSPLHLSNRSIQMGEALLFILTMQGCPTRLSRKSTSTINFASSRALSQILRADTTFPHSWPCALFNIWPMDLGLANPTSGPCCGIVWKAERSLASTIAPFLARVGSYCQRQPC